MGASSLCAAPARRLQTVSTELVYRPSQVLRVVLEVLGMGLEILGVVLKVLEVFLDFFLRKVLEVLGPIHPTEFYKSSDRSSQAPTDLYITAP